jgi:HSP90 family molecular chaperone
MAEKQTHTFQTEVSQLLDLMIHSLYSNKEIFLRELVSNASDAIDKLKFETLSDDSLVEGKENLAVYIDVNKDKKTITITDNGIGMTEVEVNKNIGTIANSGTKKFLKGLDEKQAQDSNLIGQFGVGFYSAFIVADKVTLVTRKAGTKGKKGTQWTSNGKGKYSTEKVDCPDFGTSITLHIKADEAEFLDEHRLRGIISKYSFLREKGIANWSDVTTEHLNLLVMKMRHHGISGRSIRRHLSSVRGFLSYLLSRKIIPRTLMPTSSARFLIISCTDLVLILCILLFKNRAPCVTPVFCK